MIKNKNITKLSLCKHHTMMMVETNAQFKSYDGTYVEFYITWEDQYYTHFIHASAAYWFTFCHYLREIDESSHISYMVWYYGTPSITC